MKQKIEAQIYYRIVTALIVKQIWKINLNLMKEWNISCSFLPIYLLLVKNPHIVASS